MIHALVEQHRVERSRCSLIGDTATDIEAARPAGIEGVRYRGGSLLDLVKPVVARLEPPTKIEP